MPRGQRELERVVLPEYTDQVWHGYLPDVRPGPALRLPRLRALRPEGGPPLQPSQAAARPLRQAAGRPAALVGRPFRLPRRRRGARTSSSTPATTPAACSNAGWSTPPSPGATTSCLNLPWHESVLYETHLRGFTMLHPGVPDHLRGTCAGFSMPEVIDHLKDAGRDRGRVPARARLRPGPAPGRAQALQLLGLQLDRLLRARAALPRRAATSPSGRPWSAACTMPASR